MEVRETIPSRLRISGHWCFVHYRGQPRVCFKCGQEGHQRDKCPSDVSTEAKSMDTTTAVQTPSGEVSRSEVADASHSEVAGTPHTTVVDAPQSELEAPRSVVEQATRSVVVDTESAAVLGSVLDVVGGKASPDLPAIVQPTVHVVTSSMETEPLEPQPSVAGGKRQRSCSRSQSLSLVNKDRRRDTSPDLDNQQAAIDLPEMSGALAKTTVRTSARTCSTSTGSRDGLFSWWGN